MYNIYKIIGFRTLLYDLLKLAVTGSLDGADVVTFASKLASNLVSVILFLLVMFYSSSIKIPEQVTA